MSTQRRAGKRARIDSDDEFESDQASSSQAPAQTQTQKIKSQTVTDWDEEETQRVVKDVVRYALACEYKGKPMRRDDINTKILQKKTRSFHLIMKMAGDKLREVFGMEIVELTTAKERFNQSQTQAKRSRNEEAGSSTQRHGTSGTYILRSCLLEEYKQPDIIIQSSEDYKTTGILYVILGLIFLSGNEISSPDLYEHLDRLKVTKTSQTFGDREQLLDSFIKQGHLKKVKKPDQDGDEIEYNFYWGARAKVEVPFSNIVAFLSSFHNLSEEQMTELRSKMFVAGGFLIEASTQAQ